MVVGTYSNRKQPPPEEDGQFMSFGNVGLQSGTRLNPKPTTGYEEDEPDSEEMQDLVKTTGSSRRRYLIKSKHLNHPLVNALIEKSDKKPGDQNPSVKCEVVLFDHLLWMLDNADPNLTTSDSLEELADLYVL